LRRNSTHRRATSTALLLLLLLRGSHLRSNLLCLCRVLSCCLSGCLGGCSLRRFGMVLRFRLLNVLLHRHLIPSHPRSAHRPRMG